MSEIKKIGSFSFVDTAAGQYAINMDWSQSMSQFFNAGSQDWDGDPVSVAGVRVVPWGPDNNMPNAIRDLLEKNNLGPGILDRKVGLLYGQGPMLYRVKIENNERIQEWMEDAEIHEWAFHQVFYGQGSAYRPPMGAAIGVTAQRRKPSGVAGE